MRKIVNQKAVSFSMLFTILISLISFTLPIVVGPKPASALISNGAAAVDLFGQYNELNSLDPAPDYTRNAANNVVNKQGVSGPTAMASDSVNNRIFVADKSNNRVLVFNTNANGTLVDHIADNVLGQPDFNTGTSNVSQSGLAGPVGLAFDPVNNRLFVSQSTGRRVSVFQTSTITNGMNASYVIGQSTWWQSGAGTTQSTLNSPNNIGYDQVNNRLWVTDIFNNRVVGYELDSIATGMNASFVLGQANFTTSGNGLSQSKLNQPRGVEIDTTNNRIFVADSYSNRVIVYDMNALSNGMNASNVIGQSTYTVLTGTVTQSSTRYPVDLKFDSANNRLYVSQSTGGSRISAFDTTNITNGMNASYVIGQPNFTSSATNTTSTGLSAPQGMTFDTSNNRLWIADTANDRYLNYDTSLIASGMAAIDGIGQYDESNIIDPVFSFTRGAANNVVNRLGLNQPGDAAVDNANNRMFIADKNNNRVLIYNMNSNGTPIDRIPDFVLGQADFASNRTATTQSGMNGPSGLSYDSVNDRLFVLDGGNNRVIVFDTTTITNGMNASYVVGQTNFTSAGNGWTQDKFQFGVGIEFDPINNRLFVAQNSRVTIYDTANIVNGMNASYVIGQTSFTGGGTAVSQSGVQFPRDVAYDSNANRLFVVDSLARRVTMYELDNIANGMNASGVLGQADYTSSGAAKTQSGMWDPYDLAYDNENDRLFVSDPALNRVTVYDVASFSNGAAAVNVIGQSAYNTNTAQNSQSGLNNPSGLAYDSSAGRLYVSQDDNNRVSVFDASLSAGFVQSQTSLSINENAGTGTFTVALTGQPSSNVVLDVSSSSIGVATVSPSQLTFTPTNWNTTQTVTVTGVNNPGIGVGSSTITTSVDVGNSDAQWSAVPNETISVSTIDDDVASFTLSTTTLSVSESGANTFTAVLGAAPSSDVVLSVGSSNVLGATVSPSTLTFNNGNWNSPQIVTVTGVDDANTLDESVTITVGVVAISSDDDWDLLPDQTIATTVIDDDIPGFTQSALGATSIGENAGTTSYTIVLDKQPVNDVILDISSSDTNKATVAPTQITYTHTNWDTPQTITITGVDNNTVAGNTTATITAAINPSSDTLWTSLTDQSHNINITEDDVEPTTTTTTTATTPSTTVAGPIAPQSQTSGSESSSTQSTSPTSGNENSAIPGSSNSSGEQSATSTKKAPTSVLGEVIQTMHGSTDFVTRSKTHTSIFLISIVLLLGSLAYVLILKKRNQSY